MENIFIISYAMSMRKNGGKIIKILLKVIKFNRDNMLSEKEIRKTLAEIEDKHSKHVSVVSQAYIDILRFILNETKYLHLL
jgi:hypothetical protein